MPRTRWLIVGLTTTIIFWLYVASHTFNNSHEVVLERNHEVSELRQRIIDLEKELNLENESMNRLQEEVKQSAYAQQKAIKSRAERLGKVPSNGHGAWKEPIPVLVFACNRQDAVGHHIQQLIHYRPSAERFPIVVSQDCDDMPTANVIKSFGEQVIYVKHIAGDKANITVAKNHLRWVTYYRIARHYKLALRHVFEKLGHTSVIITEDDLDIAPDFFEYFSATRFLLDEDQSLYCVSAWNDNGKPHSIDMKVRKN
ncbi:unnamed protein product, partial [Mesorhabditis belari]|uniref:Alpha-1,3-mannosyl-glycoprotein 2-beta-N-acetylglucosaminyltransferase n=1 Tax=Mesorhabditis belari TaxID=2138241 RepID=A0AAF3J7P1_9BILA